MGGGLRPSIMSWHKVKFVNTPDPPHSSCLDPPTLWRKLRGREIMVQFRGRREDLTTEELQQLDELGCAHEEFFFVPYPEFDTDSGSQPALCRAFFEMD
jgi:hypothetical protein